MIKENFYTFFEGEKNMYILYMLWFKFIIG